MVGGLTATVAVTGVPVQPFAVGVIVNVTVTGAVPVVAKAPVIFPVPLAGIPVTVAVLFLDQLYVVPLTPPLKTIGVMVAPEQNVCEDGLLTAFGLGFTDTCAVTGVPAHP